MAGPAQPQDAEAPPQAVVVADSFDERFAPLTRHRPRCLAPLCNVPLLEYTLEALALGRVREVFVVCTAHADLIKQYILNSSWADPAAPMQVHVIVSRACMSVGDVLRELDAKSLLDGDFVLCHGADVVSNVQLDRVVALHRQRRAADPNTIMTMVLKDAGSSGHAALSGAHAVFALDDQQRCVQLVPLYNDDEPAARVDLTPEVVQLPHVTLRNDLIDCGIDVCTVEVLALFSENFDYQHMRADFVRGILESDLFVKSIYAHIVEAEYAARVRSTQMYDVVSQDLMARWLDPIVPEALLGDLTCTRANVYRDKPVLLARTTVLGRNVVLGSDASVGHHSIITASVIGRGCWIGQRVSLSHAYLWDRCRVGDGCRIEYAILADGVKLNDNVTLGRGCVLGAGVVVGSGRTIPPHTRIMVDGDAVDEDLVGPDGLGVAWTSDDFADDLSEDADASPDHAREQLCSLMHDIGYTPADLAEHLARMQLEVQYDEEEDETEEPAATDADEIRATIQRALDCNHTIENALLELNTLKFACNLGFADLRAGVVPTLLDHVFLARTTGFKAVLARWAPVLKGIVYGASDQQDVLWHTMAWFDSHPASAKYAATCAMVLYDADVCDEDAFKAWWASNNSSAPVCKAMAPFIEWLQQDDEDDEDEESGSDDAD